MAACQSHYIQEQIRSGDPTCWILPKQGHVGVRAHGEAGACARGPRLVSCVGGPAPHPVFLLGLVSQLTAGAQNEWEPDGQTDTRSLWCRERPPHPLGSRCIQVGTTLEPVPTQLRDEGRGMVASVTA